MAGRPAAPVQILPPNAVLIPAAVARQKLGPFQLRLMLDDDVHPQLEWLAARGLLKNSFDCPRCAIPCSFVAQHEPRTDDGGSVVSVIRGTVCEKVHFLRFPQGNSCGSYFPGPLKFHFTMSPGKNCRGLGEFHKRHLCGRCATKPATTGRFRQQWPAHCCRNRRVVFLPPEIPQRATCERAMGFAAIERDSGLCMMEVVPDRTAQTLVPLIQQWCLPGTHIISDG